MQYGADILTYQRTIKVDKQTNKKVVDLKFIIKVLMYFFISLLISRVMLINFMAPFGIAFLLSMLMHKEEKITLVVGCGTLVGYASLYNNVKYLPAYLTVIGTITVLSYIVDDINKRKKLIMMFVVMFVEFTLFKLLVGKVTLGVTLFTTFFEIACIYPLYYIINYSITCFSDLKSKHLFNNEEIISMAVTASLVVAGTWGASIYGVSVRNVLALGFILVVSYIKGSSVGAASGVALGVIVGMGSNNMMMYVSVYGLCGLISGIFKDSGKVLTGLAYIVSFLIINIYSKTETSAAFKIIEALIACLVFYSIPKKIYDKLALELDYEKKQEDLSEGYVEKVKNIFIKRLDSFSEVLYNMSDILENLADNDKLAMKNKSTALVENLADRVCSNCNMKAMCWKRETYYTYSAFGDLIQNFQEKRKVIPKELERKCVKRTALVQNTEDIVNNYIINEMWRTRLSEGRELLAAQINNMAASVGEIIEEFNADIKFNCEAENNIIRVLEKKGIKYRDIFCYNDKNDRTVVKLTMDPCGGSQLCVKEILPLLNEVLDRPMCVSDEGCSIHTEEKSCSITFEEMPKFHVSSYAGRLCKDGEKYSGDSFSFGKLNDGTYMAIISDGMGSGPQAEQESTAAVELIEKFAESGFSKATAINTVNSIMTLKFSEDEKFSTVDLSSVDLYAGEVDFMKVGAVASFIKSGNRIETIKSKTLPMGILDKVDIDIVKKTVKNGDIIVMVSDGMLDYDNEHAGKEDWVVDFLGKTSCSNPKELAEQLINKAKELSGEKIKDDMTVLVSKVYSLY